MRAKYLGNGAGNWKGVVLSPGLVFDVPENLQAMVQANANFEVAADAPKRGPGRPPKVQHDDAR